MNKGALISGLLVLEFFAVWFWNTMKPVQKNRGTKASVEFRNSGPGIGQASSANGSVSVSKPLLAASNGLISAAALKQIGMLEAEKAMRTPPQQKIDSQLLYARKMQNGVMVAEGVPRQRVNLDKDDQGRILLDIKADVSDALLQYIELLGGTVINVFPQYQAIRAAVPLQGIENLA